MSRIFVACVLALVLIGMERPVAAQTSGFDPSSGYGYLPDGHDRLASSRMSRAAAPGSAMAASPVPSPSPITEFAPGSMEGDFVGSAHSAVGWQVIGDYLYIRPSNAEVAYAQVTDAAGTLPIGRAGVVTPFYDPGFRVSASRALGDCAAIGVTYAEFDTTVNSTLLATDNPQSLSPPASTIRSLLFHSNSPNFGDLGETAAATERVRFQIADIDYKASLVSGPRHCLNVVVGGRFLSLRQDFNSSLSLAGGQIDEISSNTRFDGGGVRVGLEGERQAPSSGFLIYGKSSASFVAGTFRADYSQFNNTLPASALLVDVETRTNRMLSMLDIELGAGWSSEDGTIRVTGGWMASGWYNTIKPANFIRSVQTNNASILDSPTENMLAFDGLVFRVEWRF